MGMNLMLDEGSRGQRYQWSSDGFQVNFSQSLTLVVSFSKLVVFQLTEKLCEYPIIISCDFHFPIHTLACISAPHPHPPLTIQVLQCFKPRLSTSLPHSDFVLPGFWWCCHITLNLWSGGLVSEGHVPRPGGSSSLMFESIAFAFQLCSISRRSLSTHLVQFIAVMIENF